MIHPLENRYRTEIADIFEESSRINRMLQVELALAQAHVEQGTLTKNEYDLLFKSKSKVTVELVKEIEKETHHDTMALVEAFTRVSGCDKVHLGATSSDIVDSALALQLREANQVVLADLLILKNLLLSKAEETKNLVCIGRTHGQHAIPMTYGMKFALWAYEITDCLEELRRAKFYGKMSGAVGTFASFGEKGVQIQTKVLHDLGLSVPLITNQVVSRVFVAKYIFNLITIVSIIEKMAKEIRNLQRSEIQELAEPFAEKQTGSSTMPHKRNPILSENLCSLAKRVRTNILPALENISLEHERDLTNSANERIIIPETVILTHFMIKRITRIIVGLDLFPENIRKNVHIDPAIFMEKKMVELVTEQGLGRQEAYSRAKNFISKEKIDPEMYLGLSEQIVLKTIELLRSSE
ncbi:adenylosuccinate lyase [Candidatus Heimdallarchaeota archaeon B3_Heim]|nr:MAG: adenylosuccinate lyase [Candidatus Heimdallarchaeota archaeon B3_Heim]